MIDVSDEDVSAAWSDAVFLLPFTLQQQAVVVHTNELDQRLAMPEPRG